MDEGTIEVELEEGTTGAELDDGSNGVEITGGLGSGTVGISTIPGTKIMGKALPGWHTNCWVITVTVVKVNVEVMTGNGVPILICEMLTVDTVI